MEWEISGQDSCSDHSIIRYVIGRSTATRAERDTGELKYKFTKEGKEKFQSNLIRLAGQKLCDTHNAGGTETRDKILCTRATKELDIEKSVKEFCEILEVACRNSFQTLRVTKTALTHKTVPWWSDELTIMRKRLNALRRRYQRTRAARNYDDSAEHYTKKLKQITRQK